MSSQTTNRMSRFTGGDGSISPRGYEHKGACPKCQRENSYVWAPEGTPIVCQYCKATIVDPWSPTQPAGAEPARKAATPSATAKVLAELPRFAKLSECSKCRKAVWFWDAKNAKGEPQTYIFDHKPTMVFGLVMGPAGDVAGIEKRTCFLNHFLTCPSADHFRKK